MTCSQCKYEFCWLCLGDYKSHNEATGGPCNMYQDVVETTPVIVDHKSVANVAEKLRETDKKL